MSVLQLILLSCVGAIMMFANFATFVEGGDPEWTAQTARSGSKAPLPIAVIQTDGINSCVSFSPDGKQVAIAAQNSLVIHSVSKSTQHVVFRPGRRVEVRRVAFALNGSFVVSALSDGNVHVLDPKTWKTKKRLIAPNCRSELLGLAVSPNCDVIAASCRDGAITLWDTGTWTVAKRLRPGVSATWAVEFSADSRTLFAVTSGGKRARGNIIALNMRSGKRKSIDLEHGVTCVGVSRKGKFLVTGADRLRVWQIGKNARLRQKHSLPTHKHGVWAVAFSPDGRLLVSGGYDDNLHLFDVRNGKLLRQFKGHTNAVLSAGFSPDGKTLVTASKDGTVKLWNVTDLVE